MLATASFKDNWHGGDPKLWPLTIAITLVIFSPCICCLCSVLCRRLERPFYTDVVRVELRCADVEDTDIGLDGAATRRHPHIGAESFGDVIRAWKGGDEGVLRYPVRDNQRILVHAWMPQYACYGVCVNYIERIPREVDQHEAIMEYATRDADGRWVVVVSIVRVDQ